MLADGTLSTIENEDDIYISLTQLCEYFTTASINIKREINNVHPSDRKYAAGMQDMMFTIAQELLELGKFEAQRRMIDSPEDLLKMIDKSKGNSVE